jgi:cell shape-determining protein MreC
LATISKVFFRCFIVLIAVLFFQKKSFDPKLFLQSIAVPFLAVDSRIRQEVNEILLRTESRESLIEICKELINENLTLKLQSQKDQGLRERLENLEELLQIGKKTPYQKVYARVIKRETSAWFESIVVNGGSKGGVKVNALVIARDHIVGKVVEVSDQFSVVALTSSPKFRLAIQFENFAVPLVFNGGGSSLQKNNIGKLAFKASGIVKNIPTGVRESLRNGAKIFAASLANTDFNVPLGNIVKLQEQADGVFLQATIDLPEITHNLREILIIIPYDL